MKCMQERNSIFIFGDADGVGVASCTCISDPTLCCIFCFVRIEQNKRRSLRLFYVGVL